MPFHKQKQTQKGASAKAHRPFRKRHTDAQHSQTESKPAAEQKTVPVNAAYLRTSDCFRIFKYCSVLLLVVFVLFMFTFYRENITIENFRFFLRYIDTRNPDRNDESVIKYDSSSISTATLYKGSVAVADSDSLQIYDLNGDSIFIDQQRFSNPNLLASEQYILSYNTGGTTYRIYNSVARLHEQTLDYQISSASINRNGMYCIVSKTKEYRASVSVFDQEFKVLYQWFSPDKFVMDTAISDNNRSFIILSCTTNITGSAVSEILLCELGTDEKTAVVQLPNIVALSVCYNSGGGFTVLCDDGFRYYDKNAEQISFLSFNGVTPIKAGFQNGYSFYAVNKNVVGSDHTICVAENKTGSIQYQGNVTGEITDYVFTDQALFLLMERQLVMVPLSGGDILYRNVTVNGTGLLAVDQQRLLLCFPEKTELIDIQARFYESAQ